MKKLLKKVLNSIGSVAATTMVCSFGAAMIFAFFTLIKYFDSFKSTSGAIPVWEAAPVLYNINVILLILASISFTVVLICAKSLKRLGRKKR